MAPPARLVRKAQAGHLGRKTGRGFFEYDAERRPVPIQWSSPSGVSGEADRRSECNGEVDRVVPTGAGGWATERDGA